MKNFYWSFINVIIEKINTCLPGLTIILTVFVSYIFLSSINILFLCLFLFFLFCFSLIFFILSSNSIYLNINVNPIWFLRCPVFFCIIVNVMDDPENKDQNKTDFYFKFSMNLSFCFFWFNNILVISFVCFLDKKKEEESRSLCFTFGVRTGVCVCVANTKIKSFIQIARARTTVDYV